MKVDGDVKGEWVLDEIVVNVVLYMMEGVVDECGIVCKVCVLGYCVVGKIGIVYKVSSNGY